MTSWELLGVVTKLLYLLSIAMVAGGLFCLVLIIKKEISVSRAYLRYIKVGAWSGFAFTLLYFLVQIGSISQSGVQGMIDFQLARILLSTGLGYSSLLRILGFAVALAVVLVLQLKLSKGICLDKRYVPFIAIGFIAAGSVFSISFSLVGHAIEFGLDARIAVALHVLAAFTWIGSFVPLISSTRMSDSVSLFHFMETFGNWMIAPLVILLATGMYLVVELIALPGVLLTSAYGIILSVKVIAVMPMLLLALTNKLVFVPNLVASAPIQYIRLSVSMELVLGCLILSMTSFLTTVATFPAV